jgi:hypothetical protein
VRYLIVAVLAIAVLAGCSSYDPAVVREYRADAKEAVQDYKDNLESDYFSEARSARYLIRIEELGLPMNRYKGEVMGILPDEVNEILNYSDEELAEWMKKNGLYP